MRHLYWGIVTLFFFILKTYSQNPIISHSFTADPTARVFDGKIYLYPSHDIKSPVERLKDWFCMEDYHVYSSQNLVDWTDHGVILSKTVSHGWIQSPIPCGLLTVCTRMENIIFIFLQNLKI